MKVVKAFIFLGLAGLVLSQVTNFPTQSILIRGDLTLNSPTTATNFQCPQINVGNSFHAQNVTCARLDGGTANIETLDVSRINGRNGKLTINTDLVIHNLGQVEKVIAGTLTSNAQNIWLLASHESFERIDLLQQWNFERTTNCNDNNAQATDNVFLGGPCLLSTKEVQRNFENLPEHSFVRVKAKYHMFDNWAGEYGYMKLNQDISWIQYGSSAKDGKGVNVCGGEAPDPAFNLAIDVTIPHNEENLLVSFGSSLTKDPCHASYGIDDIEVYVK